MAEIEGTRSFAVAADVVWTVAADPARLAEWVPTMRRAQPAGGAPAGHAEVHLEGESHGHPYSLDSTLRADQDSRTLHWGSEDGDDGYRGRLQVLDQEPGSQVRLHVTVPDGHLGPSPDAAAAELRRGMDEALGRLEGLVGS